MSLRSLARLTLYRLGLMGVARRLRAGRVIKPSDVMKRESVESLVSGADEYYRSQIAQGGTAFLKSKPFHSFEETPQVLVRLGWLLEGARLTRGLHIVEFGGGAGWLAATLWQMACHVTCVDASAAALELARQVFDERRPLLRWAEATCDTALTDGRTIALEDESMDRVICFDIFHHVPNQAEVLGEFFRVLRPGGMACFCEPGRYHSTMKPSQDEMANFRVLENDIVIEDIWQLARDAGFTGIDIRPMIDPSYSLSMDGYLSLLDAGRVGLRGREALISGTVSMSVFFLQKGTFAFDSRYPSLLGASIAAPASLEATAGVPVTLKVVCTNTGQARWLSKPPDSLQLGLVDVGIMRCDANGTVIERDWRRAPLPRDVEPGDSIDIACELTFGEAGTFTVRADLVSEQLTWFNAASDPIAVNVSADTTGIS
jgi:2-polyprenyl-3-methyl-5-hydroxy-6-metoxy-1,4-benzoquinol methylase